MSTSRHTLHPCCRVRGESFGLLFYDMRGPKLLFAATGDALDADAITGGKAIEESLSGDAGVPAESLEKLIQQLKQRGFLREQPIC